MAYMPNEMPEVSFVLMICQACGTKDSVVKMAAMNPIIIFSPYSFLLAENYYTPDYKGYKTIRKMSRKLRNTVYKNQAFLTEISKSGSQIWYDRRKR